MYLRAQLIIEYLLHHLQVYFMIADNEMNGLLINFDKINWVNAFYDK